MPPSFDPCQFIARLGEDLIRDFESARQATTPGMIGSAAESPVRKKLENLLPNAIGVGSGCIIDTYGNTSQQIDVVLFERDICPVFSLNDTPETTYYPCERVIAVGEVKSVLNKADIEDSFEKIKSVKSLKRNFDKPLAPAHPHTGKKIYTPRHYGQRYGKEPYDMDYDPFTDEWSEIFGFVLAGRTGVSLDTMHGHVVRLFDKTEESHCPNVIVSLTGEMYRPQILRRGEAANELHPSVSARSSNIISSYTIDAPFGVLLQNLYSVYRYFKTSWIDVFEEYLKLTKDGSGELSDFLPEIHGNHARLKFGDDEHRFSWIYGRGLEGPAPIVKGLL